MDFNIQGYSLVVFPAGNKHKGVQTGDSLSGAQCNDKEKQPNKTLLQPDGATFICKPRAWFWKLFPCESPAKPPVKVRYGIFTVPAGWINSGERFPGHELKFFKISSNSNCSVHLCVQNWPCLEKHLTYSAHSEITGGTKLLSQVNFHIRSITGLPKTPRIYSVLAAQKLVGVQKKLNPLFEISLWKAAMGLAGHLNDISFSTASSHCENLPGLFQRTCEFPIK